MSVQRQETLAECNIIFQECEQIKEDIWKQLTHDKQCVGLLNQWRWDLLTGHVIMRQVNHTNRPIWVKENSSYETKKYQLLMAMQAIEHHAMGDNRELAAAYAGSSHFRHEKHYEIINFTGLQSINKQWDILNKKLEKLFIILKRLCDALTTIHHRRFSFYSRWDIEQCIKIALMEASRTYHTSIKCDFIGHLYMYIEKVINRMNENENGLVRLPTEIFYQYLKFDKFQWSCKENGKGNPTAEDFKKEFRNLSDDKINAFLHHPRHTSQLTSMFVDEDVDYRYWMNETTQNKEEHHQSLMIEDMLKKISFLPEESVFIIKSFFGINCKKKSASDLAKLLKINQEKIDQIIQESLAKLKEELS